MLSKGPLVPSLRLEHGLNKRPLCFPLREGDFVSNKPSLCLFLKGETQEGSAEPSKSVTSGTGRHMIRSEDLCWETGRALNPLYKACTSDEGGRFSSVTEFILTQNKLPMGIQSIQWDVFPIYTPVKPSPQSKPLTLLSCTKVSFCPFIYYFEFYFILLIFD